MELRSVSVNCPLDHASLETLGMLPFLERFEIDSYGYISYHPFKDYSPAVTRNAHAFLQLIDLSIYDFLSCVHT
jgi:hypothetical protein